MLLLHLSYCLAGKAIPEGPSDCASTEQEITVLAVRDSVSLFRSKLELRTLGAPRRTSYLSLGPMYRHGWLQRSEAGVLWAPQAEVGNGDHQPGQESSAARCTWGDLCRTRPLTSSRPVKERDTCLESRKWSCLAPACSPHAALLLLISCL